MPCTLPVTVAFPARPCRLLRHAASRPRRRHVSVRPRSCHAGLRLISRGDELHVFAFTTTERVTGWDVLALSRALRERGWQVPADTFPADAKTSPYCGSLAATVPATTWPIFCSPTSSPASATPIRVCRGASTSASEPTRVQWKASSPAAAAGGVLTVVRLFELDRRDVAQRAVQPGPQRHLLGVQGQLGQHPRGGAPPTTRAAADVGDERGERHRRPGRQICQVDQPQLLGRVAVKSCPSRSGGPVAARSDVVVMNVFSRRTPLRPAVLINCSTK